LSRRGSPEYLDSIEKAFPSEDGLDDWQLTPLHKIVVGLTMVDLRALLEASTADINQRDAHGRTPLWWAVNREDVVVVSTLLEFDADPGIADSEGFTPMHNAAIQGNVVVTGPLLKHEGRPSIWNTKQGHPLLHACWHHDEPSRIEPFLGPGVDINDNRVRDGLSPLHTAANYGFANTVARLLDAGADINVQSHEGTTVLMQCQGGDQDKIIVLLLARGADYAIPMNDGQTILHVAAGWSKKLSTIQTFREHGLHSLDPRAVTVSGDTAADLADSRENDDEFKAAFLSMLEYLTERWDAREAMMPSSQDPSSSSNSKSRCNVVPGAWPVEE
jgi:ankyrin repeat protein